MGRTEGHSVQARDCSLHHRVQDSAEVHRILYPKGTEVRGLRMRRSVLSEPMRLVMLLH
jgi:hypothetical protein